MQYCIGKYYLPSRMNIAKKRYVTCITPRKLWARATSVAVGKTQGASEVLTILSNRSHITRGTATRELHTMQDRVALRTPHSSTCQRQLGQRGLVVQRPANPRPRIWRLHAMQAEARGIWLRVPVPDHAYFQIGLVHARQATATVYETKTATHKMKTTPTIYYKSK